MSRKIKESSSSNNTTLDEIKALINGRFDEFSEKFAWIKEKFDKTMKESYSKLDKIEKDTEESRIKTSKNSDVIEGLKFHQTSGQ